MLETNELLIRQAQDSGLQIGHQLSTNSYDDAWTVCDYTGHVVWIVTQRGVIKSGPYGQAFRATPDEYQKRALGLAKDLQNYVTNRNSIFR